MISSDVDPPSFEPKSVSFTWIHGRYLIETTICIPSELRISEHLAILVANYRIPIYLRDDLREKLASFIVTEETNYYDANTDLLITNASRKYNANRNDCEKLGEQCLRKFEQGQVLNTKMQMIKNDDVFREAYKSLLVADPVYIRQVLKAETEFAKEMQRLIKERDWEVERLKKEHNSVIDKAVADMGVLYSEDEVNRIASKHFERLHFVESNYASQISEMMNSQRNAYRALVLQLNEDILLYSERPAENNRTLWSSTDASDHAPAGGRPAANSIVVMEESYTIHLGAQQKTMHNLRLISIDAISLCRQKGGMFEESRRLQMALSLYSGQLQGVVLLVDPRPNYHTNFSSDFAKACEQSTEMHFADLDQQLQDLEDSLIRSSQCRAQKLQNNSDRNSSVNSDSNLKVGDVYLTRHCNLSQIHVAFHLVVDDILATQDINSRHPCINGLRNIIRLCYKFNISTISLPLLLIRSMTEELTVAWCVKRAELVFKCVKGFMMECATLSGAEQYTVQFLVPPEISPDVFHQLSDILMSIFHLAKPVVAAKTS